MTNLSKNKLKVACFLTVRTSSSRLPQKCLLKINGKRAIEHLIDRVKLSKEPDLVVLCTSDRKEDDILEKIAVKNKIKFFRGSLDDKLTRWQGAVEKFGVDYFIISEGDDLFIDPGLIDRAVTMVKKYRPDVIYLADGLVCGIFSKVFGVSSYALNKVYEQAAGKNIDMTELLLLDRTKFKIKEFKPREAILYNNNIRMTLDYKEDLLFFRSVFKGLDISKNDISIFKIINFLKKNKDIAKINISRQDDYVANREKIKTRTLELV